MVPDGVVCKACPNLINSQFQVSKYLSNESPYLLNCDQTFVYISRIPCGGGSVISIIITAPDYLTSIVTRLHLLYAIAVTLHVHKTGIVILTPETAGTVGV